MDSLAWGGVILASIGTLMMRVFPLMWMQRHLQKKSDANEAAQLPVWLGVLGPSMIAAMLGVSLVPSNLSAGAFTATLAGSAVTWLVWRGKKSLGWPIFAGVCVYGLVVFFASV